MTETTKEVGDVATKITHIIQRSDGSEARIVAEWAYGLGLHRSVGVYVHKRQSPAHEWVLCDDRPAPGWKTMPLAEYERRGRSEMLRTVSHGEILRATSALGRPMSEFKQAGH